ncbi:DUF4192 domain-containing protein [Promicromonospora thailandica]|uniref:DUF4192 family protein n=1 Tax=Promicromonospora thailandica TaxID=765201 RepID=A0A9X2JW89_9MICO|nr:DUF4192 domain-containing protein [Promicromonospora thailandica]MCP2265891.1 protein of unknown function (DUF4192) [Promicromonospora thailandica]
MNLEPFAEPFPEPRPEPFREPSPEPPPDGGAGPAPVPGRMPDSVHDRSARLSGPAATVVRVAGPEDLLAYIPYRLGFQPAESVVAVSLTGPRRRVGLVARVDIDDLRLRGTGGPDGPDGPDGAATARWLTEHVLADGADRAVVVLYTATDPSAPTGPARRAVEVLRARLERRLPGVEAWLVAPTGFRALDCTDPLCCPPQGRPLSALTSSRVAAHMVLEGRTVAGTREERYALRPASETARTQARRAAARWSGTYRRLLDDVRPPSSARTARPGSAVRDREALAGWGAESLRLWRSAVRLAATAAPGRSVELSPVTLGKIGAALADTPVRDAVLLSLAPGTEDTALRTARREADEGTDAATGAVMAGIIDPVRGVPPDTDLTGPARDVLEAVVAHVPRNRRAPAYLLLALIAWWHGDGGLAAERVTDALGVDPGYRLAQLLRSAIVGGVPPGWVRREQERLHGGEPRSRRGTAAGTARDRGRGAGSAPEGAA